MKKIIISLALFSLAPVGLAEKAPILLGYWGNWHVWDQDKNERSDDEYQIPGSINKETRATVVNPVFQKQIQHLNAVAYAFLDVYPDAGMHKNVPQKPIDTSQIGKIYWTDPWTDLFNDANNAAFCQTNPIACYFAYEIEKDPDHPRPAVDKSQPWNYFYMGNFDAFTKLQKVKRIISIGGWYHEDSFEKGAFVNPDNFIQSLIAIINKAKSQGGNIDGVDLDYEPPTGYTRENATKLVNLARQLRAGLNKAGMQQVTISAAVFASPEKISVFGKENWQAFAEVADFIGIMGYDFHGSWDDPALTGLQSNLYQDEKNPNPDDYSSQKAVEALINAGVPKSKLLLGLPSYGRVVGGVKTEVNEGLYQAFDPKLVIQEDLDKGQVSYYKIVSKWINKDYIPRAIYKQNKVSGVWAYNPSNYQFVSFDNTALVDTKAQYVVDNGLAGMMMWEMISDVSPDNDASLVKHMNISKK